MKIAVVIIGAAVLLAAAGCSTPSKNNPFAAERPVTTQSLTGLFGCLSEANMAGVLGEYQESHLTRQEAIEKYLKAIRATSEEERERSRPAVTRVSEYVYSHPDIASDHMFWQAFSFCRMENAGFASAANKQKVEEQGKKCPTENLMVCYREILRRL